MPREWTIAGYRKTVHWRHHHIITLHQHIVYRWVILCILKYLKNSWLEENLH